MKEIRKVVQLGDSNAITLPRELGLKRGDFIALKRDSEGRIILIPITKEVFSATNI